MLAVGLFGGARDCASMKVSARKRRNFAVTTGYTALLAASMKVSARKRRNVHAHNARARPVAASMKVSARKRRNAVASGSTTSRRFCLNEGLR